HLLAQPVQVAALAVLDELRQDASDTLADAFDGGKAFGALERLQVRALEGDRPCGPGEGLGPETFLFVLAQEIADLGQRLRRSERVHHVNCVSKDGQTESEAGRPDR